MTKVILDASALIAYVRREPGADQILDLLPHGIMSAVNYAEVVSILSKLSMTVEVIELTLKNLITTVIDFDQTQALISGILRRDTKTKGLSLGDRACLALGMTKQLPIYTADKVWAELALDNIDIRLIR